MRQLKRFWIVLALATSSLISQPAMAADRSAKRGIGETISSFELTDTVSAGRVSLPRPGERKATVLIFLGIDCPIGNLYMPRLVQLAEQFGKEGVVVLGINSNYRQGVEEIAANAREYGVNFPILHDEGNVVADALQAERTCEVLVLDSQNILRYRGAIDDQYGLGYAKDAPSRSYLAEALSAVLAGKVPETQATTVFGCPIERDPARSGPVELADLSIPDRVNRLISAAERVRAPSQTLQEAWRELHGNEDELIEKVGPVTYSKHVAPIIQAKCVSCHRPGEVGPFSLTDFGQVSRRLQNIGEVVDLRRMPPWHADPRYGHFANDRSLTPEERATVLAWIEQGAPEGDPADLPPPRSWPTGWSIGEPDLVLKMDQPFAVKADGFLTYQHFRIKVNFPEDRWIQAAEARPGDRSVVHHIIAYLVRPGQRWYNPARDHLCGYAPGDMPTTYPIGTAKRIPAGSDIILEIHYTPNGKVRLDQSAVGFVFAKEPFDEEGRTVGIANERILIQPNDSNSEQYARGRPVQSLTKVLAFMPHMHLRGKAFEYYLLRGGKKQEKPILSVPSYDFGWQSYYYLAEPLVLQPGDSIDCKAVYDNSANNPVNPEPNKAVGWGDQTWQEMMIGYIDIATPLGRKLIPDHQGRVTSESAAD